MYESVLKIMSHNAKVTICFYRGRGEIAITANTE